jgi:xanthine dehydrogenase iron-sulfur cluster and FAD-binding subunit A
MLAVQVDGSEIMTVEGLAPDGRLHPIQEAFLEEHGLQCGFCTPGFLVSIHELLARRPDPTDDEIMDTLGGHICRCTGYQAIVSAVRSAAEKLRASGGTNAAAPRTAAAAGAPRTAADAGAPRTAATAGAPRTAGAAGTAAAGPAPRTPPER